MSAKPRSSLSGRGAIVGLAVVAALVIGALVLLPRLAGPVAVSPGPSVIASSSGPPTASASTSPPASATATATAASGRFANSFLGYSIQMPPPWRRSGCLSVKQDPARPDLLGVDGFTSVPPADESYGDVGGPVGTVSVAVERNPSRLTADEWARAPRMGPAQVIEPATLDGRPGVRTVRGPQQTETTHVAVDDLMYTVSFIEKTPADPTIGAIRAVVASFAFVPRVATPSATAPAPRSAEAVADGLTDGFARKDVAVLGGLMGDCVIAGAERAGFGSHSPERFTQFLRDAFAAGRTVVVRPRPLESAPGYGAGTSVSVATTWTDPGRAPARVDLIIGADGAFHYWRGTVQRQQPPP